MSQVVKSDTASTTALSSAISPPISSVVLVAMLATWPAIVSTANVAAIGATVAAHAILVLSARVMPWIVRWR